MARGDNYPHFGYLTTLDLISIRLALATHNFSNGDDASTVALVMIRNRRSTQWAIAKLIPDAVKCTAIY